MRVTAMLVAGEIIGWFSATHPQSIAIALFLAAIAGGTSGLLDAMIDIERERRND